MTIAEKLGIREDDESQEAMDIAKRAYDRMKEWWEEKDISSQVNVPLPTLHQFLHEDFTRGLEVDAFLYEKGMLVRQKHSREIGVVVNWVMTQQKDPIFGCPYELAVVVKTLDERIPRGWYPYMIEGAVTLPPGVRVSIDLDKIDDGYVKNDETGSEAEVYECELRKGNGDE